MNILLLLPFHTLILIRDSLDITDESLDKRINDIEKELEQIYNQKAKGAQIRSREKWVELGEKNNSYFWV